MEMELGLAMAPAIGFDFVLVRALALVFLRV